MGDRPLETVSTPGIASSVAGGLEFGSTKWEEMHQDACAEVSSKRLRLHPGLRVPTFLKKISVKRGTSSKPNPSLRHNTSANFSKALSTL